LALTTSGAVYSWGFEEALGIPSSNAQAGVPVRIPAESFNNHKIVSISAARDFSVALCDQGHLYAWGSGLLRLP
jgi:alpha-tubulin suppressor-like RCC1 family protein